MRWSCALLLLGLMTNSVRADDAVDFDTEIVPILTRAGCNAGSCHGAAIGRGGFKLSLLGSDAAADHAAIVHQLQGRRVNLSDAEKSLLLKKPAEQLGHEGGLRLEQDSPHYSRILHWISQGGQRIQKRRLTELVVNPSDVVSKNTDESFNVHVTAMFDDGQSTDVTLTTVLTADDPDAVKIDADHGKLTVTRRGIHTVIARFLDRVVPIRITVPLNDDWQPETRPGENQIDVFINRQLDQLRLPSSPPAPASQLLRRITLDLVGRLPTLDEYRQFGRDASLQALVDRLLDSEAHARYWALKWANILAIDSKQLQPEGARVFHDWLAEQIQSDTPITVMAKTMLTSLGDGHEIGPVNFLRSGSSPGDLAEHASRVFMGARLRCANCHNHPLDRWTQDDYHGLAAIFAKVKRDRVVSFLKRGEVTHPVSGQAAIPRIPGDRDLAPDTDGRIEFANWLTGDDNPYLATVTVNRLWQQLMGRGLVEPADDLRATNPATNPDLLDWLARDFAEHGYRMKHTLRTICLSHAYRRSSQPVPGNEADTVFFSRYLTRPLEAEVIADAIADATGVLIRHGDQPTIRAVALTDNRALSASLQVLGRCDRMTDCASGRMTGASLARTLHLINGPLINDRISHPDGRLAKALAAEPDNEKLMDRLYLITLGRPADNRLYWRKQLSAANLDDPQARAEFFQDLFWGLLTSESFITNH